MASPFSVFRKNQKLLMAIACLLAIISFVFLPMIGQNMGASSREAMNPTVVKTSEFGDLRESDIRDLLVKHRRILDILTQLGQASGMHPAMVNQFVTNQFLTPTESNVVDTWLLANQARKMGMVVSNDTVNAFLKEWTQDSVKSDALVETLKRSGLTVVQFFHLMSDELMARQMRQMFLTSLGGLTPAERWEYFSRVKKMAAIEAVPVEVAGFVQRVDDPGDKDLQAFFDEYKNQYATPNLPDPGFREPPKVALQWFKADGQKFLDAVTDKEIEERYQKNKAYYDDMEKKFEEAKAKALKEQDEAKEKEKASTKDAKSTNNAAPADVKKEEPGKNTTPPKPAEPKQDEKKESKPATETKQPETKGDAKGSSSVDRKSPFRLVAMMQEKKADEKKDAPKADDSKPAAKEKAAESPKAPAAPEKKTENAVKAPAAQEKPADAKNGMADATKKRIRQEIAQEKLSKVLDGLREKMDQYRNEWSKYKVAMISEQHAKDGQSKTLLTPPPKPNFEKLAAEAGLTTGQTDLMAQWQIRSQPIGASFINRRFPVSAYVFQRLSVFHPEFSEDILGNGYLFWKTDETKDRVPEFSDQGVRSDVLRAWKMIKARSLAMKEATSIAEEVRKTRKTLKEALADRTGMHVIMPPPFSWMTFGNVPAGSAPGAARYSEVVGVPYAGDEFMRTVFHLEPSQVGTAFNTPKNAVYVIQLNEFTPSHEVLWKEFEVDDFSKYAPIAMGDQYRAIQAWLDEIKSSAGLKWQRPADQNQSLEGAGEE